ncbi:MAG: hypothetical protein HOP04_06670 [Methylophilaceae bacterium]|nr:hypothetical protein [Methylophilaceae bacterium]
MHPSVKIALLLALVILAQTQNLLANILVASVLVVGFVFSSPHIFYRMLKRMRWLIISMMFIFSFSTPGEYVRQWPFELAPTYEGLSAGLLHVVRLLMVLAGLSLLLATSSRESLIAGFYQITAPLRNFNIPTEKFAARLCLTLHYAEQTPRVSLSRDIYEYFHNSHAHLANSDSNGLLGAPEYILLHLPALTKRDKLVVLGLILAGLYWL